MRVLWNWWCYNLKNGPKTSESSTLQNSKFRGIQSILSKKEREGKRYSLGVCSGNTWGTTTCNSRTQFWIWLGISGLDPTISEEAKERQMALGPRVQTLRCLPAEQQFRCCLEPHRRGGLSRWDACGPQEGDVGHCPQSPQVPWVGTLGVPVSLQPPGK